MLEIVNDSNVAVNLTYYNDGHQVQHVLANSSMNLNFQTNSQPSGKVACYPAGAQIWISGTPGVGLIYMTGYYTDQT